MNKVGFVDNEFRVLPMELLAGDSDTLVTVLESGCQFQFDFKDVFWNSRLQLEHNRIIGMMKRSDIVCTPDFTPIFAKFRFSGAFD